MLIDSIDVDGAVVTFTVSRDVAIGTLATTAPGTGTLTAATTDADIARTLFTTQYTRTALVYHDDDTEYLDAAWMSRCLAFDLDTEKGIWAFKTLNGVPGVDLTTAQATAIRSVNANYFAPIVPTSGVETAAYTAQGWVSSGTANAGRRIDVTTSLDWLQARLEEAILNVMLRETHGLPYTDAGINKVAGAVTGVFNTGVNAGHLVPFVVPTGEDFAGKQTPYVVVPLLRDTSTTDRANRTMSFSAVAYLRSAIEKVTFALEVRQ